MRSGKISTAALVLLALAGEAFGQVGSRLVANLEAGKKQTVVAYGTSLTAYGDWVGHLREALEANYPGRAAVVNSGRPDMSSRWGLANLETRVIAHRPDTVLIEFAINDACLDYNIPVAEARQNLDRMIDRIRAAGPDTEIILMTMNPPVGLALLRRPRIRDYYRMYREAAAELGLLLIDHARNWERILEIDRALFDRYVPDGIHPGPEGCAAVITPAVLAGLGIPRGTGAEGAEAGGDPKGQARPGPGLKYTTTSD